MTNEEHMLMLLVYFKQQQAIRILLDMLKSRGVLTADDEAAFASAQTQDIGSNAAIFDEAKAAYLKMARSVEVETGLGQIPEPPSEWSVLPILSCLHSGKTPCDDVATEIRHTLRGRPARRLFLFALILRPVTASPVSL